MNGKTNRPFGMMIPSVPREPGFKILEATLRRDQPSVLTGINGRAAQINAGAAIPPEEDAVNIDAAIAVRATFAQDSPIVFALFEARIALLTGGEQRQQKRSRTA